MNTNTIIVFYFLGILTILIFNLFFWVKCQGKLFVKMTVGFLSILLIWLTSPIIFNLLDSQESPRFSQELVASKVSGSNQKGDLEVSRAYLKMLGNPNSTRADFIDKASALVRQGRLDLPLGDKDLLVFSPLGGGYPSDFPFFYSPIVGGLFSQLENQEKLIDQEIASGNRDAAFSRLLLIFKLSEVYLNSSKPFEFDTGTKVLAFGLTILSRYPWMQEDEDIRSVLRNTSDLPERAFDSRRSYTQANLGVIEEVQKNNVLLQILINRGLLYDYHRIVVKGLPSSQESKLLENLKRKSQLSLQFYTFYYLGKHFGAWDNPHSLHPESLKYYELSDEIRSILEVTRPAPAVPKDFSKLGDLLSKIDIEIGGSYSKLVESPSFTTLRSNPKVYLGQVFDVFKNPEIPQLQKNVLILALQRLNWEDYRVFLNQSVDAYYRKELSFDSLAFIIMPPKDWSTRIIKNYRNKDVRDPLLRLRENPKIPKEYKKNLDNILNGRAWIDAQTPENTRR